MLCFQWNTKEESRVFAFSNFNPKLECKRVIYTSSACACTVRWRAISVIRTTTARAQMSRQISPQSMVHLRHYCELNY